MMRIFLSLITIFLILLSANTSVHKIIFATSSLISRTSASCYDPVTSWKNVKLVLVDHLPLPSSQLVPGLLHQQPQQHEVHVTVSTMRAVTWTQTRISWTW